MAKKPGGLAFVQVTHKEAKKKVKKKESRARLEAFVASAGAAAAAGALAGQKSRIPVNVFGANKRMIKMTYVKSSTHTSGDSTDVLSGQLSYRLNNINLPFVGQAEGGILPQGYTQAAQAYRNFRVMAAKVKVEYYDPSDDMQVACFATSSGDTQTLQNEPTQEADQFRGCTVKNLSTSGSRRVVMSRYYNIAKLDGAKKGLEEDSYNIPFQSSVATATTDEAGTTGDLIKKNICKFHSAIAPNGPSSVNCRVRTTIVYYVLVNDRTILPTSTSSA